jgi:hypothetical protein
MHHFFCSSHAFGTVADVPEQARYASLQDLGAFCEMADPTNAVPVIPTPSTVETSSFQRMSTTLSVNALRT